MRINFIKSNLIRVLDKIQWVELGSTDAIALTKDPKTYDINLTIKRVTGSVQFYYV